LVSIFTTSFNSKNSVFAHTVDLCALWKCNNITDWLWLMTGWLTDWLADWLTNWLIDWLTNQLTNQPTN
jgi:hypothetical protein